MTATGSDNWHRATTFFLLVFAAALPHSIAAAQIAAGLAAILWLGGCVARPQWPRRTLLDIPVLVFVVVSLLSAVFSLEPAVSLVRSKALALLLIPLLVADTARTRRQVLLLVAVLLVSAAGSAGVMVWEKIIGRGVEVTSLDPTSPLAQAGVQLRDVIVSCDGKDINSAAEFQHALAAHDPDLPLHCRGYHGGAWRFQFTVPPDRLPSTSSPEAWGYAAKTARSIRARGTYSHFTTYAEVMMQLAALTLGLWLTHPHKWSRAGVALSLLALLLVAALGATFTRASWAALVLAGLTMLWLRVGWRARLAALLVTPLALLGLNTLLVRWRGVGFYNPADPGTQYRQMIWADGLRLIKEHPLLGIGLDSIVLRWKELGVRAYDQFGLHSHFHSTPIQIAVERGLVGLAAWLLLMVAYVRFLLRLVGRTRRADEHWSHGLALGVFGATAAFLASSLVHYNFGDSEVVMVLWLLAGVILALERLPAAAEQSARHTLLSHGNIE